MIWPAMVFNLCVALLFAGFLLRAVRRFDRRADAIMAKMDKADAESERKFNAARDEIIASMRMKTDRAIAEMRAKMVSREAEDGKPRTLRHIDTTRPSQLSVVPNQTEIEFLPRSAQVAFASRCARRALPLLEPNWPDVPQTLVDAVARAVDFAEQADLTPHVVARDAANAARGVANAARNAAARGVADAAYHAANRDATNAVRNTAEAAEAHAFETHPDTFATFNEAARKAGAVLRARIEAAVRRDYEILRGLCLANGWTDNASVPPSVFGPLWPDRPPEDWPKPANPATEIVIEFPVPDEMTTDDAVAFVKELSAVLCALDLAGGGHGIAIQPPLEITAPAFSPVGAPGR